MKNLTYATMLSHLLKSVETEKNLSDDLENRAIAPINNLILNLIKYSTQI